MNLGEFIRSNRKELNLTTTDLSSKLGVTQGYISHIENGRKQPTLDVLKGLSKALNINYVELLIVANYVTKEEILTYNATTQP